MCPIDIANNRIILIIIPNNFCNFRHPFQKVFTRNLFYHHFLNVVIMLPKNSFHLFHMNVFLSAFKTFNSGWWDSLPFSLTSIFILKLRFENLKYREKINWSSRWSMAAIFSPVRKLDFFHINLFSPNLKIIYNLQEFDYLKGLPVRNVSQIFHWDYRKTINHMLKLKSDLKKKNLSHVFYSVIC